MTARARSLGILRVPPRLAGAREMLDDPGADPRALAQSLADLRVINRLLGFTGGVVRDVWPLVTRAAGQAGGRAVTLLDAGAGSGDIALALAARARRARLPLAVLALDGHAAVLEAAREHLGRAGPAGRPVRLVRGDALRLPLGDRAVDVVLASLLVHHLDGDAAVRLLAELRRVTRVGLVVSDLVRHPLALLGFRVLSRLGPFHPMTRHDGALSVRRAYTEAEMADLAARAGLRPGGRLVRHPLWRMAWVWSPADRPRRGFEARPPAGCEGPRSAATPFEETGRGKVCAEAQERGFRRGRQPVAAG